MARKDTAGKPKLRLIPYKALAAIADIREYGINKYGCDEGWKEVDKLDFLDAALRHINKYLHEGKLDDESGKNHIAHAACSLVLALALEEMERSVEYTSEDDDEYYDEERSSIDQLYERYKVARGKLNIPCGLCKYNEGRDLNIVCSMCGKGEDK